MRTQSIATFLRVKYAKAVHYAKLLRHLQQGVLKYEWKMRPYAMLNNFLTVWEEVTRSVQQSNRMFSKGMECSAKQ